MKDILTTWLANFMWIIVVLAVTGIITFAIHRYRIHK